MFRGHSKSLNDDHVVSNEMNAARHIPKQKMLMQTTSANKFFYLAIGIVIGAVADSAWNYCNQNSLPDHIVVGVQKKRPLQVFPLLKELKSGWKNLQVPPLLHKNATGMGALVVDVGLHKGGEFFHAIDNGFEVVGFEPNPQTFPTLAKQCMEKPKCNIVDLEKVTLPLQREPGHSYLINAGAANKKTVLEFSMAQDTSSFVSSKGLSKKKKVDVPVVRVDDIIRDDIYLLKVDTQGYDQFVIEGASEIFKNHVVRQVIVEIDPFNLMANNLSVHGFLEVLQSNGMMCFTARSDVTKKKHCRYFGDSVEGFEVVFDGKPGYSQQWADCFEDFLCLNTEKIYPGKFPESLFH